MILPNPKELKALLKVCREFGVDNVEVGELKIKFGEMDNKAQSTTAEELDAKPSDEEMIYWSSQPDPLEGRQ